MKRKEVKGVVQTVKKCINNRQTLRTSTSLAPQLSWTKTTLIPLLFAEAPVGLLAVEGQPDIQLQAQQLFSLIANIMGAERRRRKVWQEAQDVHRRYERIQQIARIGSWTWTVNDRTQWSSEIFEIFELEVQKAPDYKEVAKKFLHPEDRKDYLAKVALAIKQKASFECDYRIILPGGKEKTLSSQAIFIEDNGVYRFEGVIQDVTHYYDVEKSLATQIKNTDRILQNMLAGVVKVDNNGQITFANDSASHYLRESKASLLNRHFFNKRSQTVDLEGRAITQEEFPLQISLDSGKTVVNFIHGLKFPDGSTGWFSLNTSRLYNETGRPLGAIVNFYDITEEINARKQLEESKYLYQLITENSKDLITLYHLDGSFHYISPNAWDVIGYSEKELKKITPQDLIHKDDLVHVLNANERVRKGENNTIRYRINMKTGEARWYETHGRLIRENGEPIYMQTTTRPIHEQKIAEDRLQQSERRFRRLVNEAPFAIEIYDKDGTLRLANKRWEEMWGIKKEEVVGHHNLLNTTNGQFPLLSEMVGPAFKGERGIYKEWAYQPPGEKEPIFFNTNHFALNDHEDQLEQVIFIYDQITQEVRSRQKLQESEQKFRAMTENLPGAIYLLEQTENGWQTIYINEEIKNITGHSRNHFIDGKVKMSQLLHDDDLRPSLDKQKNALTRKRKFSLEYRIQRKDGSWRWIKDIGVGLYDHQKKLKFVEGYVEDVTERKKDLERLKFSENKFRTLFEDSSQGIIIMDALGNIQNGNKKASQLLGYKKGELLETSIKEILHPDRLSKNIEVIQNIANGGKKAYKSENIFRKKDGKDIWVRFDLTSYEEPENEAVSLVGIFSDITREKISLKEIQSQELRFRSIFQDSGHGVAILDAKMCLIEVNKRFKKLLGTSEGDLKRRQSFQEMIVSTHRAPTQRAVEHILEKKIPSWQEEIQLKSKNGHFLWIRLNLTSFEDPISEEVRIVSILEDITTRKEALTKLTISEKFQHETVNAMPMALMVMEKNGQVTLTNAVWDETIAPSKIFGRNPTGNFLKNLKKTAQGDQILAGLEDVLNGRISILEMEVSLGLEHEYWFAVRAKLLDPQFNSMVITMQDITVRRRIEQALEESLDKYRKIYNKTPIMMHSIDQEGHIMSVSDFWLIRMGYQRHEVIGREISDFISESFKKEVKHNLKAFYKTGAMFNVGYQFVTKNGQVLDTLVSAIREGKGKNTRSLAVVTDITELKQAENELQRSRQDLIEAQQIAKIGNFELDLASGDFHSSRTFDDLLEVPEKSEKKLSILKKVIPASEQQRLLEQFTAAWKQDKDLEYTSRAHTLKSDKPIWISGVGRIIKEEEKPVRVVGTIQDVTKGKLSEIEIQKLSDRLSLATESAGIGVWELDPTTGQVMWEDTMYILYQMKKPYPVDPWKGVLAITHPDDHKILNDMLQRIAKGDELIDADYRLQTDTGERHLRSVTRQLKNEVGEVVQTVGVSFDITKNKELLENLEHSLREKDILIKEVHHRVKNNMQMVSSILALKSLDLTDEESKFVFDDCTNRIKSMAVVHDQLYRFYNVSEIDINEYLSHLLRGLNVLLGGGAFEINVHADNDTMDVDRALLCGLIISEIVGNAFKHGFKGKSDGVIDIKFNKNGENRSISIINDGHPIPKDIFERQTNSLGMSLIRTFSRQLEGTIGIHPSENGFLLEF